MNKSQMIDQKKRDQMIVSYQYIIECMQTIESLGGSNIPFIKEHCQEALNLLKKEKTSMIEFRKFLSKATTEMIEYKKIISNDSTE